VNTERAEDVLMHKRMLEEAKVSRAVGRPIIHVRAVRVSTPYT